MKQLLISLFLILPVMMNAQVTDDFSDGNVTDNPSWTGDTAQFEVNTGKQLHLKSSVADTSYLSTVNSGIFSTEWNFWIKLSFNTSANNYARIYFCSSNQDLEGPLNGYYLQIGGSNDSVVFFRQTGTVSQKLFRGSKTFTGNPVNTIRVKMIHDDSGTWHLFCDPSGGTNWQEEGSAHDLGISSSGWLGFVCRYTSSNATKFYFDDIYAGPVIIDSVPPRISYLNIPDKNRMEVLFSEIVSKSSAENVIGYHTNTSGSPHLAVRDSADPGKVLLTFSTGFPSGVFDTLAVYGISDISGNVAGVLRFPFCNYKPGAYDVVISEIMADPDPPYGLPQAEYVELFNRTCFPVKMKDWQFEFSSSRKQLPDITIGAYGFVTLSKGTMFSIFGPTIDLFTSSSSLANEGTTLVLKDDEGRVIHSVSYSPEWYDDPLKADGGWSLEMTDPSNPCGCADNWHASASRYGGTPGEVNSLNRPNPDTVPPRIQRASVTGLLEVKIFFSEPMDSLTMNHPEKWMTDNGAGPAGNIILSPPLFNTLSIELSAPLEKGLIYTIQPPDSLKDCAGNLLQSGHAIRTALPDSVSPGDVVINEILSNPVSGGKRFVELFNRSGKIVDLKSLVLALFDTLQNEIQDAVAISPDGYLLFPGDFAVLSEDPEDIKSRYYTPNPDGFPVLSGFPSCNDDEGTVVVAGISDAGIVDKVKYTREMHFPLLNFQDGVSLERIDPFGSSDDYANWHSAASGCGYATPGYRNSQEITLQWDEGQILTSPEIFTPDNDGADDILSILIRPDKPGYMGSVFIFDERGILIRQLVKNRLLQEQETFFWDGTDGRGTRMNTGIYLLFFELINAMGEVRHYKHPVVLGSRL